MYRDQRGRGMRVPLEEMERVHDVDVTHCEAQLSFRFAHYSLKNPKQNKRPMLM
jgi:hypothetical protein